MSFYGDNHIQIFNKDCRSMSELTNESVQCVVTSPPYWGLRKYSGEQDLIWGDNHCEHQWVKSLSEHDNLRYRGVGSIVGSNKNPEVFPDTKYFQTGFCSLCGAWKGAFGLEPTPEMYIQHTIEILREIRRVLREDGVVFFNIGDSYSATRWSNAPSTSFNPVCADVLLEKHTNLPPKNLCLIPFRIAIEAQKDGWWVRSVIIWSKPNPMPESVTDRPTESHEYILMLTKSARYYWDADAVREPQAEGTLERYGKNPNIPTKKKWLGVEGESHVAIQEHIEKRGKPMQAILPQGRNIRTVWEFPTQPYPEAHFAVFPEKLPEICIKAATPEVGCCSKCGAPWERIVKRQYPKSRATKSTTPLGQNPQGYFSEKRFDDPIKIETLGWQPACKCNADKSPSLVLDPFAGAGTTLWVAKKLNRRAVGYEISEEYCGLNVKRNRQQVLL